MSYILAMDAKRDAGKPDPSMLVEDVTVVEYGPAPQSHGRHGGPRASKARSGIRRNGNKPAPASIVLIYSLHTGKHAMSVYADFPFPS